MLDVSAVSSLAQTVRPKQTAPEDNRAAVTDSAPVSKKEAVGNSDIQTQGNGKGETEKVVQQAQQKASLSANTRLSILFDDGANLFVARSVENESGEVVNQFPPEQFVKRVTALVETLRSDNKPKLSFSV